MDRKKRKKIAIKEIYLIDILDKVQSQEIGVEVGKNMIMDLFNEISEIEREPYEWVTSIKLIQN